MVVIDVQDTMTPSETVTLAHVEHLPLTQIASASLRKPFHFLDRYVVLVQRGLDSQDRTNALSADVAPSLPSVAAPHQSGALVRRWLATPLAANRHPLRSAHHIWPTVRKLRM